MLQVQLEIHQEEAEETTLHQLALIQVLVQKGNNLINKNIIMEEEEEYEYTQDDLDNHANQLNPHHSEYQGD